MGFIQEFFNRAVTKNREDPEKRAQTFQRQIEAAQKEMEQQRVYSNMQPVDKKSRYHGLDFNPIYEQRTKMFAHKQYERRPEGER